MHELSLAMSLIEGIEEECAGRGGLRVRKVFLRVGALSGVSPDALGFAYAVATEGTALEGTEFLVEPTPGTELELYRLEVDP